MHVVTDVHTHPQTGPITICYALQLARSIRSKEHRLKVDYRGKLIFRKSANWLAKPHLSYRPLGIYICLVSCGSFHGLCGFLFLR